MTPEDLGDAPILLDTNVFSWAFTGRSPADWYEPFLAGRLWVLSFATVAIASEFGIPIVRAP